MIGNTIEYQYNDRLNGFKSELRIGVVVDAWTKVIGKTEGAGIFGFSEVNGDVKSDRMYKVQHTSKNGTVYFDDIYAFQLRKIIEFKAQGVDEKIVFDNSK